MVLGKKCLESYSYKDSVSAKKLEISANRFIIRIKNAAIERRTYELLSISYRHCWTPPLPITWSSYFLRYNFVGNNEQVK